MRIQFFLIFSLVLFAVIVGCATETTLTDADEQLLDDDLSEIDSLEEDLNLSELDEIDALLEEIES